jgi:predicted transcriptional regulator
MQQPDQLNIVSLPTLLSNTDDSDGNFIDIAKALASEPRIGILEYLSNRTASVTEIAKFFDMPITTASLHLKKLEDANIVSSRTIPGKHGQQRIYTRLYDTVVLNLGKHNSRKKSKRFTTTMPVGAFVHHDVVAPCGLAAADDVIGSVDDTVSFSEPDRYHAHLVWLTHGFLEYRFPNYTYELSEPKSIQLSMELCSEAAPSAEEWPSDIFLDINNIRVGTWTSPADFADRRGTLTPAWWADGNTQYGWLKVWQVDQQGSHIDGLTVSSVSIKDLSLPDQPYISVRIGIDDNAVNKGGMNIFGRGFGDHTQDIVMDIRY